MKSDQSGFGAIGALAVILVVVAIGFVVWKVTNQNNQATTNTKTAAIGTSKNDPDSTPAENVRRLSSSWLLRESPEASIRVPDGFKILAPEGETLDFLLADAPQGYLKYTEGETAEVVGEPHKHFELGILAGFNSSGWNDRGDEIKTMQTYSGLQVVVKEFKQTVEPDGVDFAKGTTLRQYTVIKGDDSFNVDYAYIGEGVIDIVEEMVKSVVIK